MLGDDKVAAGLGLDELRKCLAEASPEERDAVLVETFEAAEKRLRESQGDGTAASEREPWLARYALFKLLTSKKAGPLRWRALREAGERWEPGERIAQLWSELEEAPDEDFNSIHWSKIYHRDWLFHWFLSRYDLRAARRVLGGGTMAAWAHVTLLVGVVLVFSSRRLDLLGAGGTLYSMALLAVLYLVIALGLAKSFHPRLTSRLDAFVLALQSLVPRLAGASAVGVLLLASSQELLQVVVGLALWWLWLPLLVVGGWAYCLLEMSRHVQPLPPPGRLALQGVDVTVTALGHSFALALLGEGALVKVLRNGAAGPPLGWSQSLSVVVFVFVIGLIVNLIWAEQPVTEPL
jgi:hypothetical protein